MNTKVESGEKVVQTACGFMCGNQCGHLAYVKDGVLVKVGPAKLPGEPRGRICASGLSNPKLVYHPDRLKYPLKRLGKRGEDRWQRISWNEALDTIANKFKDVSEKYGTDSVAWINEALSCLQMGYQRLADTWGGTIISTIGNGDSGGPCGDTTTYGTMGLPGGLPYTILENPKMCVIWGQSTAENARVDYYDIMRAKENGARVVVIDPRFTSTAAKASEWIPIRPGTDGALALGMIHIIINEGLEDKEFITNQTVGPFLVRLDNGIFLRGGDIISMEPNNKYIVWDTKTNKAATPESPGVSPALRGSYIVDGIECKPAFQLLAELAAQYPVEKVSEITEVAPEVIRRLTMDYVRLRPVSSYKGMGLQRAFHGDLIFRAISALAAVTGNTTLNPFKGFVPNLIPFLITQKCSKSLPILNMLETIMTEKPYPIKALWIAHHNVLNQLPNFNKMINEVLPHLELLVVADLFMNTSAKYADIVLPVCTHLETFDVRSPMGLVTHHIMLQEKAIEPLYESRSDFQIAKGLAIKLGVGQYFQKSEEEFLEEILTSNHPSMVGISLNKLREGPVRVKPYPSKRSPFRTPSNRIEFYSENRKLRELGESLPVFKEPPESARQPLAKKYPLCLMTPHTKYRPHSMFANFRWQREVEPEPVLEMNPIDAKKRDIYDGDTVVVFNDRGRLKVKVMVHPGLKPGVVSISEGWWQEHFVEGTINELTHYRLNPAMEAVYEANSPHSDALVEVKKAAEE